MPVRNVVHLSSWCLLRLLAAVFTLVLSLFCPSFGEKGKGIQLFSDVSLYSMSSFNVGE